MMHPRDLNLQLPTFAWHYRTWDDIQSASWFTKMNWINMAMFLGFVVVAILQARSKYKAAEAAGLEKRSLKAPDFPPVEELPDFDWRKTEPIKLRPFKPKYHLTMALESLEPNDLILMDKNYADRIKYRRQVMKDHHDNVVNVDNDKRIRPAVVEFYTFILGTYLPVRYPTMFRLHETDYETGKTFMLQNTAVNQLFPAIPTRTTKTTQLLETLGRTLDEDFLFLLPEEGDANPEKEPKYVLHAFVTCCPSGFSPLEKLGKRLADIHAPVPGYADKLEGSMDRFFTRVEVGKYVKRVNWSVTTHAELYASGDATTHAHEGDVVEELDDVDPDQTFVRCERQTLHRLPKSKALVFAFKTYLYPISQIKDEGLGDDLAQAIDGLKDGNVPGMHFYKRGAVWGEAVKKYLRS